MQKVTKSNVEVFIRRLSTEQLGVVNDILYAADLSQHLDNSVLLCGFLKEESIKRKGKVRRLLAFFSTRGEDELRALLNHVFKENAGAKGIKVT